jgi:hypothetical protein
MEKIVIVYDVGDGYSYAGEKTEAIMYESVEALYVNLEKDIINHIHGKPTALNMYLGNFIERLRLQDVNFYKTHNLPVIQTQFGPMTYTMPEIYTLDDWFKKTAKEV